MMLVAFILQISVLAMALYLELNPKIKTGMFGSALLGAIALGVMVRLGADVGAVEAMITLLLCAGLGLVIYGNTVTIPNIFAEAANESGFGIYMETDRRKGDRRKTPRKSSLSIKNDRRQGPKFSRSDYVIGGWQ